MCNVLLRKPRSVVNRHMARSLHLTACFIFSASVVVVVTLYQLVQCKFKLQDGKSLVADTMQETDTFSSTCSLAADRRGPHQRVIAYSLYGDFSRKDVVNKYLKPFKEAIEAIPLIYPGWIVRIYHNKTKAEILENEWLLENIFNFKSHVDICNVSKITRIRNMGNLFGMTWRWLPLIDQVVDSFMSRDTDSQIIFREEAAVREWLVSDRIFHVMRDHPHHCIYAILGGMWGVKINQDRAKFALAFKKIFSVNHLHKYNYDQFLLKEHIWPIAKTNMMMHDSYCCEYFPISSKPFPTQRNGRYFVGGRDIPEEELKDPCPQQCRPKNVSSDWIFC